MDEKIDPFAESEDPSILYVLKRWGEMGDSLVIEGRVEAMTATWELKRGEYNSENLRSHSRYLPDNLKCDIIIRKPEAEIVTAGGDIGIVGAVFRQFARELGNATFQLMVQHMDAVYHAHPTAALEPVREEAKKKKKKPPL